MMHVTSFRRYPEPLQMTALTCPAMISPMAEEQPLKKLHPFFTGERPPTQAFISQNGAPLEITENAPTPTTPDVTSDSTAKGTRPRKRRKTDAGDKSLEEKGRRTRRKVTGSLDSAAIASIGSNSPEPSAVVSNLVCNASPDPNAIPPAEPDSTIPPKVPHETLSNPPLNGTPSTETKSSKKIIKFNPKTGTLGSPPKPKPKCEFVVPSASDSSSTGRKGKRKSLVIHIKYGHDDESRKRLGGQIEQILVQPANAAQPANVSKQTPKSQTTGTPKPTHPFFSGKPKKAGLAAGSPNAADTPAKPPRQVIFSSTPCSPKRPRAAPPKQGLTFGIKSAGLKVPGAALPLWPPQGMAHIRALDFDCSTRVPPPQQHFFPQRKSKGYAVSLSDSESILQSTARTINFSSILASLRQANSYDIPPPPPELRLPQKHFETGPKIQRRIKPHLKTHHGPSRPRPSIVDSSDDELGHQVHPAINKLFTLLKSSLSAYDRSDCESSCWAQKYAPQTTAEVLQAGKECALLREWLLNLKVQSVDTGATPDAGPRGKALKAGGVPGKKKKKRAKLDGFIVSSDDEADELDEISDSENNWMSPKGKGSAKTVIRCGDLAAKAKDSRLTNAVVISGPHGCGKTAAVYAIARELDYEVFEINASSRRSGKDVIEKVGDMTRNHLVQQQRNGLKGTEGGNDTDADETALDVKSGKQSTMAAFFKPKTTPAAKPEPQAKDLGDKPEAPAKATQSPKSQKQSLILLEEVDILYEEDKQFWTTIVTLIAQSKRPFIMTCNDESLVPLQSLSLHGIFRFNAPPTDLAVDAMLLIAANEGHVLERQPVEDLYLMRSKDFRASLADLNYWCQIGVGDRRGGMDWFYSRWPKGSDLDENGDIVRVISEGTYRAGMGCFGRDVIASCLTQEEVEEELVNQTWESWGVSCDAFLQAKNPKAFVACNPDDASSRAGKRTIEGLAAFEDLAESMSTADLLANGGFGQGFKVIR